LTKDKRRGINKPVRVPNELVDLINIDRGKLMSRTKLGGEIYKVIKSRGLIYEGDKRVMRVDDELCKIFKTTKHVNNSTDPKEKRLDIGFNFYNLQSIIKSKFNKCYKWIITINNDSKD
jgi:hypothetical protein